MAQQPSRIEDDLLDFFEELEQRAGKDVNTGVKLLPERGGRVQITLYQDSGGISEVFTFPNGLDIKARAAVEAWLEFYYDDPVV
jgi:hypothetical protein